MKKISMAACLLGAGLLAGACGAGNQANLSGEIEGVDSDTLLVCVYDMSVPRMLYVDTVPMTGTHFETKLADTTLLGVQLLPLLRPVNGVMPAMRMSSNGPAYFLPGDRMVLTGSIDDYEVTGTELYDGLAKQTEWQSIVDRQKEIIKEYQGLYQNGQAPDQAVADSLMALLREQSKQETQVRLNSVKADPNSIVSGYFTLRMSPKEGVEAIQALSDEVKNGALGKAIAKAEQGYQNALIKEQARENIKPGKPAPDFKLKNLDGQEMTLASFKGKYMVLDFWGTWCGWCIKGIPDMKKYYAKYKDRMEIVGVCCGDTEEKWRAGVAEHELPWTNLFNGDGTEITNVYAISGYPTKVLIDPEGKIVDVFVGESPALYEKLDKLFK